MKKNKKKSGTTDKKSRTMAMTNCWVAEAVLFRMNNSFDYYIKEICGKKVRKKLLVTLSMLTYLEKKGGWLRLQRWQPSTAYPCLYDMDTYRIETRYLIGDACIHLRITSYGIFSGWAMECGWGSAPRPQLYVIRFIPWCLYSITRHF